MPRRLLVLWLLVSLSCACRSSIGGRPRVLMIGVDGVSWDTLSAMIKAGEAPNFARLQQEGAWGDLESDAPVAPSGIWTTIATGRPDADHHVVEPIRFESVTGRLLVPERAVSAIWEVVAARKIPAGVINWPSSAPVPPNVQPRYDDLALYRGLGLNAELAGERLTVTPSPNHLQYFVGKPPRGGEINATLAAVSLRQIPALTQAHWSKARFLAVFLDGLNTARHYAGAVAARGDALTTPQFGRPSRQYVRDLDNALGDLLALADRQTLVLVASDDASYAPGQTPQGWFAHPVHGIVALLGPGVAAGRFMEHPTILDFVPAALTHLGLPTSSQMTGAPFPEAWVNPPAMRPKEASLDLFMRRPYPPEGALTNPEVQKRAALLERLSQDGGGPFNPRNQYAVELLLEGQAQGALSEATRDLTGDVNNAVSQFIIGEVRLLLNRPEEAMENYAIATNALGDAPAAEPERTLRVLVGLAMARTSLVVADPEGATTYLAPVLALCRDCLDSVELMAQTHLTLRRPADAAAVVEPALRRHPEEVSLWLILGRARQQLSDARGAREAYAAAVKHAATPSPDALRELGFLEIAENRWADAAKHLRQATALNPRDAYAFFQLAQAYRHLESPDKAEKSLQQCLRADPNFVPAWLAWRQIALAADEDKTAARMLGAARESVANQLLRFTAPDSTAPKTE